MHGPYGYNPFWMQHCPARESPDLKHHHDPKCTDGHVTGQCCECGRHAKDFRPQIPAPPDPDPLTAPSKDDLPIKSMRDSADISSWPIKQQRALQFLRWRFPNGDGEADGTP